MLDIILTTARPEAMGAFVQGLRSDGEVRLKYCLSGAELLEAVQAAAPHLVVIDSELPDMEPLHLVQRLLMINAMVNTALISPLSEAEFHEKSEGLGVLSHLPMQPGPAEAGELLDKLRRVLGR